MKMGVQGLGRGWMDTGTDWIARFESYYFDCTAAVTHLSVLQL